MFRRIMLRVEVAEGKKIPWYMGSAYPADTWDAMVCYLIPFTLLFRWARNFWQYMRHYTPRAGELKLKEKWDEFKRYKKLVEHEAYLRGKQESNALWLAKFKKMRMKTGMRR